MNRALVMVGALLIAVGIVGFAVVMSGRTVRYDPEPAPLVVEQQAGERSPSYVWPILSGVAIAAGAACVGVGMNRWRDA